MENFQIKRQSTGKIDIFHISNEEQRELVKNYYEEKIIKTEKRIKKLQQDIGYFQDILNEVRK